MLFCIVVLIAKQSQGSITAVILSPKDWPDLSVVGAQVSVIASHLY
jgi:hypothetical protein